MAEMLPLNETIITPQSMRYYPIQKNEIILTE